MSHVDAHLQWWDEIHDGEIFAYPDTMAIRHGWPKGGRVQFQAARWVVLCT